MAQAFPELKMALWESSLAVKPGSRLACGFTSVLLVYTGADFGLFCTTYWQTQHFGGFPSLPLQITKVFWRALCFQKTVVLSNNTRISRCTVHATQVNAGISMPTIYHADRAERIEIFLDFFFLWWGQRKHQKIIFMLNWNMPIPECTCALHAWAEFMRGFLLQLHKEKTS